MRSSNFNLWSPDNEIRTIRNKIRIKNALRIEFSFICVIFFWQMTALSLVMPYIWLDKNNRAVNIKEKGYLIIDGGLCVLPLNRTLKSSFIFDDVCVEVNESYQWAIVSTFDAYKKRLQVCFRFTLLSIELLDERGPFLPW